MNDEHRRLALVELVHAARAASEAALAIAEEDDVLAAIERIDRAHKDLRSAEHHARAIHVNGVRP